MEFQELTDGAKIFVIVYLSKPQSWSALKAALAGAGLSDDAIDSARYEASGFMLKSELERRRAAQEARKEAKSIERKSKI
jgi:hypothetical protein